MNVAKKVLAACFLVLLSVSSAHAQWAVVDVNAVKTWIVQYTQMAQQIKQQYSQLQNMVKQLDQARQQYASITGDRGLANILSETYQQISPTDVTGALDIINGTGKTSQLAKQFSSAATLLGKPEFADMDPALKTQLQHMMDNSASEQGAAASVYQGAVDRYARLDDLRAQIQCAEDLKAIGELQARIQAEQTSAQNELVKLMSMNQMLSAKERVEQEQHRQEIANMISAKY